MKMTGLEAHNRLKEIDEEILTFTSLIGQENNELTTAQNDNTYINGLTDADLETIREGLLLENESLVDARIRLNNEVLRRQAEVQLLTKTLTRLQDEKNKIQAKLSEISFVVI